LDYIQISQAAITGEEPVEGEDFIDEEMLDAVQ
jgi:hypothetical protein